jgi:hypothetical protein
MNKLPLNKRVQILCMLCEGSSMRSISRVCDVSINTVAKMLEDAGKVCMAFHDENVTFKARSDGRDLELHSSQAKERRGDEKAS